jgi:hypothetical protein
MTKRLGLVGVFVVVGVWLAAASAAWGYTITPICTVAGVQEPSCTDDWYKSPVTVTWTWDPPTSGSCPETVADSDTREIVSCQITWSGLPPVTQPYLLLVELSVPTATATPSRPPDFNGWYNHPLGVTFQGSSFSGIVSCSPAATYNGPANGAATVSGTCTDNAGKSVTVTSAPFAYDATPPTLSVAPSRPPDSGPWYNHAVGAAPTATAFSGIASCTPTSYAGPSTTAATVSATCLDNAGESVSVTSSPFAFDATPPSLTVATSPGDGSVSLSWQTSGDLAPVASVTVSRSPGAAHAASDTVYSGDASVYKDTHVSNGIRYTYTITARDQAGNSSVRSVVVTPGPQLLSPAPNARLSDPPMLAWTPVRGATYYNVQIYTGDPRKVLSLWPAHPSLQLKRTWRFDGRHYRLKPGRYRWFVWPGFGKRSAGHYGKPIGSGTFIVVR